MPVYFIADGLGHVKIGVAHNPMQRMADLQVANAGHLKLLRVIPSGGVLLERQLHARFHGSHVRGEWFRLTQEIRDFIQKSG